MRKKIKKISIGFFILALWLTALAALVIYLRAPRPINPTLTKALDKTHEEALVQGDMQKCYTQEIPGCYKQVATELLDNMSLGNILDILNEHEKEKEFFGKCHELAHYLGQESFKRLGNLREVFHQANRACLGGAYHGAVEGYFMQKNMEIGTISTSEIESEIPKICGKVEEYTIKQEFTECNHGMGHGLMYLTENDLPQALKLCDILPGDNQKELCYTGALMANADSAGSSDHPTKYIKKEDPLYPCNILEKHYQKTCYTYGVLSSFQADLEKSIEVCKKIPTDLQSDCFKTIGRDRTMWSDQPTELYKQCSTITPDAYRKDCISGVAYNLFVRFGVNSTLPIEFCALAETSYKNICYQQFSLAINNLTTETGILLKVCDTIKDKEFKRVCLGS